MIKRSTNCPHWYQITKYNFPTDTAAVVLYRRFSCTKKYIKRLSPASKVNCEIMFKNHHLPGKCLKWLANLYLLVDMPGADKTNFYSAIDYA